MKLDVFHPSLQPLHEGCVLDGQEMRVTFMCQGSSGFLALEGIGMIPTVARKIEIVVERMDDGRDGVRVVIEKEVTP